MKLTPTQQREHEERLAKITALVTACVTDITDSNARLGEAKVNVLRARDAFAQASTAMDDEMACPIIAALPDDLRLIVHTSGRLTGTQAQLTALARRKLVEKRKGSGIGQRDYYALTQLGMKVSSALRRSKADAKTEAPGEPKP